MSESLIVEQNAFEELCAHIRAAGLVAFDTEFVSEHTYLPELGLLQFATRDRRVAVDPLAVEDLSAWWELMIDDQTTVVVHGGREEVKFCLTNTGRRPRHLWDVQIAEGFRSRSFPLGYDALVRRVLGKRSHGKETRSDWRRRPLSEQQVRYALEDVLHILPIRDQQHKTLKKLGRLEWTEDEFRRLIDEVEAERSPLNWQRLPGLHRLSPRDLAVARELYRWREQEAAARNRPMRKILRDDLLLDLARRHPTTVSEFLSTRDMNRPEYKKCAADVLERVAVGLALPEEELPQLPKTLDEEKTHDEQVLGQLLGIALANRCAEMNVAMSLVGRAADLRHLVRRHVYGDHSGPPPRLTQGWRATVCGDLLTDVLDGRIALRVADPHSDHPLVFERREEQAD